MMQITACVLCHHNLTKMLRDKVNFKFQRSSVGESTCDVPDAVCRNTFITV